MWGHLQPCPLAGCSAAQWPDGPSTVLFLKAGLNSPLTPRAILVINLAGAAKYTHSQYYNHLNVPNLPKLHSVEGKLQVLEDSFALNPKLSPSKYPLIVTTSALYPGLTMLPALC